MSINVGEQREVLVGPRKGQVGTVSGYQLRWEDGKTSVFTQEASTRPVVEPPPPPPPTLLLGACNPTDYEDGPRARSLGIVVDRPKDHAITDFAMWDDVFDDCKAAGLTPIIQINTYTPWTQMTSSWVAAFVGQAVAFVRRYGPSSEFWQGSSIRPIAFEVFNEPYLTYSRGVPDPKKYAAIYKAIVQAGCAADPAAKFWIAGAPDVYSYGRWAPWVDDMFAGVPDLAQYIDGWTAHPYGPLSSTSSDGGGGWRTLDLMREAFVAHDVSQAHCHITEVGMKIGLPNNRETGTEADQAARLRFYIDDCRAHKPWVDTLLWFNWMDYGADDKWGVTRSDGTLRPIAQEFAK